MHTERYSRRRPTTEWETGGYRSRNEDVRNVLRSGRCYHRMGRREHSSRSPFPTQPKGRSDGNTGNAHRREKETQTHSRSVENKKEIDRPRQRASSKVCQMALRKLRRGPSSEIRHTLHRQKAFRRHGKMDEKDRTKDRRECDASCPLQVQDVSHAQGVGIRNEDRNMRRAVHKQDVWSMWSTKRDPRGGKNVFVCKVRIRR